MPKNFHIFLKGEVGSRYLGNFTSDMVNFILDKYKDTEVHVLINSLGGYTHEGLAISSLFKIHGNVHVHFIGQSASAATIAAMGAKRITIDADAAFLVHRCSSIVFAWDYMNADQLDEHIKQLEKQKEDQQTLDTIVAGLYARRCKKSKDELLKLMSKDTWLTAQEALDWGFVDEVTDDAEDKQPLSPESAAAISSAGIPLPPGYSGKKGSMLDRFFAFLRSFNSNSAPATEHADNDGSPGPEPENLSSMDKTTSPSAQPAPAPESQAQAAQQADPQAAPESAAAQQASEKDAEIAELKSQLAERDRTIAQLRKEPAAPTSEVVESKKDEADPYAPVSYADGIAASKAFLKAFK